MLFTFFCRFQQSRKSVRENFETLTRHEVLRVDPHKWDCSKKKEVDSSIKKEKK